MQKHPLIKSLNAKLETGEFDGSDDYAKLILDSALVAEGEVIIDPRVNLLSALPISCKRHWKNRVYEQYLQSARLPSMGRF